MHTWHALHEHTQNPLLNSSSWLNWHLFRYFTPLREKYRWRHIHFSFFFFFGSHLCNSVSLKSSHESHKNAASSHKLDTLLRGAVWAHLCVRAQMKHVTIDSCSHSCCSHTHTHIHTHTSCKEKVAVGVTEFMHPPSPGVGAGKSASSEPSRSCSRTLWAVGILHRRWWLQAHTLPAHTQ